MFYKITEMISKQGKPYLKVESNDTPSDEYLSIAQPIIEQYRQCTTRQELLDLQAQWESEQVVESATIDSVETVGDN